MTLVIMTHRLFRATKFLIPKTHIMRMKRLFLAGCLVILASCSSPSPQLPPLKIAVLSAWPTYEVIFIAQERGLFAQYGVSVIPVPTSEYVGGLKLYRENKVDALFTGLTDVIILESEGIATRFVYATDYSQSGDVIVGQPILDRLSDLKGKRVSFEGFNTFSHLLVLKLLEKAGLREGDFQAANVDNLNVLEALENGKIEAGHIYGTAIPTALAKGYKILGTVGDVYHLMIEGLVVNNKIVKTRPAEIQSVVKALIEAMAWFQQFPEEGFRLIAKHNGASEKELADIFMGLHILNLAENHEAFKPNGILLKGGKEIADFFHQRGILLNPPDLNIILDDQFINNLVDKP